MSASQDARGSPRRPPTEASPAPKLDTVRTAPHEGSSSLPVEPLRPFVPPELAFAPLPGTFYRDSFTFRTYMREAPAVLVAAGRLSERPSPGTRPLRPWGALPERLPYPSERSAPAPGSEAPAPSSVARSPVAPSAGELPSLRPEEPLRSLRVAATPARAPSGPESPSS